VDGSARSCRPRAGREAAFSSRAAYTFRIVSASRGRLTFTLIVATIVELIGILLSVLCVAGAIHVFVTPGSTDCVDCVDCAGMLFSSSIVTLIVFALPLWLIGRKERRLALRQLRAQ